MNDDLCDGKQKHTPAVAKKISAAMAKRDRRALPYKCTTCGKYHVAGVLTGDLKRVKRLKTRK